MTARDRPDARAYRRDALLAAALLVGAVISVGLGQAAGAYGSDGPALWASLVYAVALTAPIALRRRMPSVTLVVVSAVYFVGITARVPEVYVGNICVFIALYSVGAWVDDRRRAALVRAAVVLAMFVWLLVTIFVGATEPAGDGLSRAGAFSPYAAFAVLQFLVNIAFFAGGWMFGDHAHASAVARRTLEHRTLELERERRLTAAQAVALDRIAIARELHDVVAHHVSAMGVQAGAARTVLRRDPDAAEAALAGVERSAREGVAELRSLLDTLRTAGPEPAASTLRIADLDALVAQSRAAGLPVDLTVIGDPSSAPDLVEVNLYRVAQEALTNARRHGGADAAADVRVRYTATAVELEVSNTGANPRTTRTGLGLVGMRERMAASGGTLEAGPRPRGGYLVRARAPLDDGAAP